MLSDNPDFGYFTSLIHSFALTKNCDCLKKNPLALWEIFFHKFNSPPFFLSKILFVAMSIYVSVTMCII